MDGVCSNGSISTVVPSTVTAPTVTLPVATTGGQHRGGDGKTDGGGEKKPDSVSTQS